MDENEVEEERKNPTSIFSTLIMIAIVYFVVSYFLKDDKWLGFYYPDGNDLQTYKVSRELKSVEECREWVEQMQSKYNPNNDGSDDYECGKNCEESETIEDFYHCKETVE